MRGPWITRRRVLLALEILFNFILPWALYRAVKPHGSEVQALIASALPPIVWSLAEFARQRKVDALSVLVLGGIALALVGLVLGGSPKLLLLRESLVTGLIGVAFLGSAAIGKPLMLLLARATMARQSDEARESFDRHRDDGGFRRMMRVMTVVWGAGFVLETCVRAFLVFSIPVGTFLIAAPIVGYGTVGLLALWTFLYGKRWQPVRAGGL